jgi:hypothetical protein
VRVEVEREGEGEGGWVEVEGLEAGEKFEAEEVEEAGDKGFGEGEGGGVFHGADVEEDAGDELGFCEHSILVDAESTLVGKEGAVGGLVVENVLKEE